MCVRWGPRSPPQKGAETPPQFSAISIVPHLDASRCHLVWMLASAQATLCYMETQSSLTNKGGRAPQSIFGPFLLCPNSWMHQDATRYGGRPHPRRVCVRWGPSPPPQKGSGAAFPILMVEVRISNWTQVWGTSAFPVVANFVALEQQIILVKTRCESV